MLNMDMLNDKITTKIFQAKREITRIESKKVGDADIFTFVDLKKKYHELDVLREVLEIIEDCNV